MDAGGARQILEAFRQFGQRAEGQIGDVVNATGLELRGDIIRRIQSGPASGRVYQKYNPRRTHRASAPGEAPATDTGRLANSIQFQTETAMSVTVGSQLAYAASLEFGTSTIRPRPAWRPAVEAGRDTFLRRLSDALARAARG